MPAAEKLTPLVGSPSARRLCALVNDSHDGNLTAAADAIGCSYDALRAACLGTVQRGPSTELLLALHRYYGRSVDWLLGLGR